MNLVIAILWETYSEIIAEENSKNRSDDDNIELDEDEEEEEEKEQSSVIQVPFYIRVLKGIRLNFFSCEW